MRKSDVRGKINNKIKICHPYFSSDCRVNVSRLLKQSSQLKVCFSTEGNAYSVMRKLQARFVSTTDIIHSRDTVKGVWILLSRLFMFSRKQQKWGMYIRTEQKGKLLYTEAICWCHAMYSMTSKLFNNIHSTLTNSFQFTRIEEKGQQAGF